MKRGMRLTSFRLIVLVASACITACNSNEPESRDELDPVASAFEGDPNVAMSGNGHGVIVFRASNGMFASSYTVEGGLESAVYIGEGDEEIGLSGSQAPGVAMDAAGNVVAVWRAGSAVYSATRPVGGGWSVPTIIGGSGSNPAVAVDAAGNAIATWEAPFGINTRQVLVSVRPAGGAWTTPRPVGGIDDRSPTLAVHRSGAGWLAVTAPLSAGGPRVPAVMPFSLPEGPVGTRIPLWDNSARQALGSDIGVAVDAAGNALVAWRVRETGAVFAQHLHPVTGPVGPLRQLAAGEGLTEDIDPQLAVAGSDSGDAILVWTNEGHLHAVLYQDSVWSDEDGAWSGVFEVDPRFNEDRLGAAAQPVLAMTADGDATLVYSRGPGPRFMSARRFIRAEFDHAIRGSGWQPITDVERLSEDRLQERDDVVRPYPKIAMETRGSALLVWQVPNARGDRIVVDVFAWAPPIAAFSAVPVGDRTVMFDARDSRGRTFGPEIGTALRQYDWDFDGNGTIDRTERGTAEVTHIYPAGGTWNPRLRVMDLELLTAETFRSVDVGGSSTTDVVFEDTEFLNADWEATAFDPENVPTAHSSGQRITSDGNPGAYRQMTVTIGGGTQSLRIFHMNRNAVYTPALQGAITAIEFREDRRLFAATNDGTVGATFAFKQGERFFILTGIFPLPLEWETATTPAQPAYVWNAGPLCPAPGPGVRCPDLTEAGEPITFGYMRGASSEPLRTDVHGIDNWRVTVRRGPP